MKKRINRIFGVLLACVLCCAFILQGTTVKASEMRTSVHQKAGGKQELEGTAQNDGKQESGDTAQNDGKQEPGDTAQAGGKQEPGDTAQAGGKQESEGTDQNDGKQESEGAAQNDGKQEPGDTARADGKQEPEDTAQDVDDEESGQNPDTYDGTRRRTWEEMDQETSEWVWAAGEELAGIVSEREIMALIYLSDEYPIRKEPFLESDTVVTVLSGQMVTILDIYVDEDFQVWEYVGLEYKGQQMYGYVPRAYLACSDQRFLEWEERYGMNPGSNTYTTGTEAGANADIEQFPESYRSALLALREKHPNWIFVKMNTKLDWNDVVYNELQDSRSLAYYTLPDWAREGLYDSHNWYFASEAGLKMYLDPRNGLTESGIFQFELLIYNEQYHTEQAVRNFLNNTFMNDSAPAPGTDMTYASIFWNVATEESRRVSPFHLVARVLQEQGRGDSALISGKYPGYEGFYNYFNVKASGTTNQQVIESGLKYAKEKGWNNAYNAILGGADFISGNYIQKGQDTLYLQKYNVNPDGYYKVYTHQYMQNISAATTEASNIRKLYEQSQALDNSFVFKIPVFENMPAEPCGAPKASTNVYLRLPDGYKGTTTMWLDGIPYEGVIRNGSLIAAAPDGNAKTAVLYRYDESGVPVGMYVWSLGYSGTAYTVTPEPELEDLLTYHGFSIRITGKSGLRCKTGISVDLRNALTSVGVNGHVLKEYGTLVMNNANRDLLPMIKDGEKVKTSRAYGINENGTLHDVVFETIEGRHRYTSVLVGIPADQYKTEFAFRGYAVIEKGGVQTIVYGPVVSRSIYEQAQRLLEKGIYDQGSEADIFLRKLISDGDAAAQAASD